MRLQLRIVTAFGLHGLNLALTSLPRRPDFKTSTYMPQQLYRGCTVSSVNTKIFLDASVSVGRGKLPPPTPSGSSHCGISDPPMLADSTAEKNVIIHSFFIHSPTNSNQFWTVINFCTNIPQSMSVTKPTSASRRQQRTTKATNQIKSVDLCSLFTDARSTQLKL